MDRSARRHRNLVLPLSGNLKKKERENFLVEKKPTTFPRTASPFFQRVKIWGGALVALVFAGTLAGEFSRKAVEETHGESAALRMESLKTSAGAGIALGTLGGFRTVLSDIAWLRAFYFWEKREPASCLKFAKIAMTLSPEQFFFLENTANYMAFEFPVWEIRLRGGNQRVAKSVRGEIHRQAMENALRLLENAAEKYPKNPKIPLLAAQIVAFKTETIFGEPDYQRCAKYYRRACELEGAPLFAFAIYAKFISEHIPAERADAEAFLTHCRDNENSPAKKMFFDELLREFFAKETPATAL